MISRLGGAGFIMKKTKQKVQELKYKHGLKPTNLLRKSFGFHFSLMNMIPMMALAVRKEQQREES